MAVEQSMRLTGSLDRKITACGLGSRIDEPVDTCRLFVFSSRRRHTRFDCDWSSDVCSSDLIITPPWSTITAYDLNTGKIMWQTPYGDTPQAGPSDKLRGNVTPRSGFVVTAGGLVLFADNQSKLYALDKNTGKVVYWRDVPNSAVGVPAVYEVNGREYILFSLVGGPGFSAGARMAPGGTNPPPGERQFVAFALPK